MFIFGTISSDAFIHEIKVDTSAHNSAGSIPPTCRTYLQDVVQHELHGGGKALWVDVLLEGTAVSGEEGCEGIEPLLNGALPQLQLQQQ